MPRIAAVLACVLVISACTGTESDAPSDTSIENTADTPATVEDFDLERVEVPELGLAVEVPAEWTHAVDSAERLFQATAPSALNGYLPNFNISSNDLPEELPMVAYFEGEIPRLRDSLPEVEVLEVVNLEIDGAPARGITLTSTDAGTTIGISRLLIVRDGVAHEVTFFAEARALEQLAPMVTAIFQSLTFLD